MLNTEMVVEKIADTLIRASSTFRPDQIDAFRQAIDAEINPDAKWALEQILRNAEVAEAKRSPLCDDTGSPHVFLEIGDDADVPRGFLRLIEEGVAEGLRRLPGRPMGVRGNDLERITQEKGLFDESEGLALAPVQVRRVAGRQLKVTVLMLGGGPEIRGLTQRVFHKHDIEVFKKEVIARATEGARLLGCQPCVLALGVGRTQVEAASYALEAYRCANFGVQSPIEKEITDAVNQSGVGPLSLHGRTTVLRTFLKVGPQRASGVRVVSLRVGCCFDPRMATCTFDT